MRQVIYPRMVHFAQRANNNGMNKRPNRRLVALMGFNGKSVILSKGSLVVTFGMAQGHLSLTLVGSAVGYFVGSLVGSDVDFVGLNVGLDIGCDDGSSVGNNVGFLVGCTDGFCVGFDVGSEVGGSVGSLVSPGRVGRDVGCSVG